MGNHWRTSTIQHYPIKEAIQRHLQVQAYQTQATSTLPLLIHQLAVKYQVNEQDVLKVIQCESSMYPNATHVNTNGTTDHGALQINDIHRPTMEKLGLNIERWEDSLTFGFQMIKREGWSPWKASFNCHHLK